MTNIIIYSIVVVICLFFSSFLSAYETALTWINRHRLKSIAKQKSPMGKRAARVFHLKESFTSSLTVILIWNNVFNILATTLLNLIFLESFQGGDLAASTSVGVTVSTILIIIFGEIIPKNLAFRYAETFAIKTVYLLLFFKLILWPLVFIISKALSKGATKISENEMYEFIHSSESEGLLEHNEKELIEAAISIKEKTVAFSMIPWAKVHSIRARPSSAELMNIVKDKYHYSRLPVTNQAKNKIVGFIKMKDVYRKIVTENIDLKNSDDRLDIEELCFAPVFVRESDFLLDALEILQQKKLHIAVVISDVNSVGEKNKNKIYPVGIITLEDVIEELIGEIYDEHDEIQFNEPIVKVGLDRFLIRGDVSFNMVFTNYLTETHKPEGDYKTFMAWVTTEAKTEIKKNFSWEYENLIIKYHKKVGKSLIFEVTEKTITTEVANKFLDN